MQKNRTKDMVRYWRSGINPTLLMAIVPSPSAAAAASVIAPSKLAAAVVSIPAALMVLTTCLMVATVTAERGAILRALLSMHLVVQVAWITPKRLLILVGERWREAGLTREVGR